VESGFIKLSIINFVGDWSTIVMVNRSDQIYPNNSISQFSVWLCEPCMDYNKMLSLASRSSSLMSC